jgi:uncharacterized protein
MAITFYDASVASYLQILGALTGVLDKGLTHCREKDIDPESIVDTRLVPDMLPFRFQIHSVVHHSVGALEGMKSGVFRPPSGNPSNTYSELQGLVSEAHAALKARTPAEIDALEGNDLVFELGKMKMPFTASGFLFSFSLPNFYFHSATAYDILRSKGTPLGKRDFMGALRMKM